MGFAGNTKGGWLSANADPEAIARPTHSHPQSSSIGLARPSHGTSPTPEPLYSRSNWYPK